MPVPEFYFLLAGMLDVTDPDKTDPLDELIAKRVKAMVAAKHKAGQARRQQARVRRRAR